MNLIVLPVLCGIEMTKACLTSLHAQDIPGGVRVMAYDNGSKDGVGPWLRAQRLNITTVSYRHTQSLSRIWNDGLRLAFESLRVPYVLIVNNDTVVPLWLYRMLVDDGGEFVTGVGVATHEETVNPDPSSRSPHPDFSCFLMRQSCYEKVGLFDEDFWAFCGDNDYHLRMHRAGVEAVSLAVPYYHIASGTLKQAQPDVVADICAKADLDRATFVRKYGFTTSSDEYHRQFTDTYVTK